MNPESINAPAFDVFGTGVDWEQFADDSRATNLRQRYILATLSNGNIALMVNMAKCTGLAWDAILGAEVARAYKPQPEVYLATARALGLEPNECMMVAAHNGELVAATTCGFRTALVRRPTEHGPHQTTDLEPSGNWDIVAEDFLDLAGQLGC